MNQQLLFSSEDQSRQTFENFYPHENQSILSSIKQLLSCEDKFDLIYLYGASGSGKTHLLRAAVDHHRDAQYLDLDVQTGQLSDAVSRPGISLLALDNIQTVVGHEQSMLFAFETLKQRSGRLLVASRLAPKALSIKLDDLRSRLMGGQVFELKMLNDDQKAQALRQRAMLRGFELSDDVISFVINRYPRDFKTLFGLLDKLDNASLSNQRKITIPFIKELES